MPDFKRSKKEDGKRIFEGRKGTRWVTRTYSLKEGDDDLLNWAAEYLGASKSETVRSAIRSFATQLQAIAKMDKERKR